MNTQHEVATEAQDCLKSTIEEHDQLKEFEKNKNDEANKHKEELARVRTKLATMKEFAKANALLKRRLEKDFVGTQNDIFAYEERQF